MSTRMDLLPVITFIRIIIDKEQNLFGLTSVMSKTSVSGSYGYQHGMTFEFSSNVSLFVFIKPKVVE